MFDIVSYILGEGEDTIIEIPVVIYGRLKSVVMRHYVGEIGKTIILDCGVDVSAATSTKIKVKKPDGTIVTWNADVYTISGVTNYLKYVTVSGDFDQAGQYEVQAYVTIGGYTGYGLTSRFEVYELFD
jgi:hypothetical protein